MPRGQKIQRGCCKNAKGPADFILLRLYDSPMFFYPFTAPAIKLSCMRRLKNA